MVLKRVLMVIVPALLMFDAVSMTKLQTRQIKRKAAINWQPS